MHIMLDNPPVERRARLRSNDESSPKPQLNAEELLFNRLLAQAIGRVNDGQMYYDIFFRCPPARWNDLTKAIKSTMATKKAFTA